MRLVLMSYFDLGESYGLDDVAFDAGHLGPAYDVSKVGVVNPLGRGVVLDVLHDLPELVCDWRDAAVAQVDRPEMELRYDDQERWDSAQFAEEMKEALAHHEVTILTIRVYAVGIALVNVEFGPGLPLPLQRGFGRCFEFAAYTPAISDALLRAARSEATRALVEPQKNQLRALTRRSGPEEAPDDTGYTESGLLTTTGFTSVVLLVDPGDLDHLDGVLSQLELPQDAPRVEFEYHGTLHFTWAACVLQARRLAEWTGHRRLGTDEPRIEVGRMLADVEIAHSFAGICDAFARLFRQEMSAQVGGYATGRASGRDPQQLNRLRSLALAVVSVTDVNLVTSAEEDRDYFHLFSAEANLSERQQFIQDACEILYNVQEAEFQGEQEQRDRMLGYILAGLTTFTVISVAVDAYNFVEENEPIIEARLQRLFLLVQFILALSLVVAVFALRFMRGPRRD